MNTMFLLHLVFMEIALETIVPRNDKLKYTKEDVGFQKTTTKLMIMVASIATMVTIKGTTVTPITQFLTKDNPIL